MRCRSPRLFSNGHVEADSPPAESSARKPAALLLMAFASALVLPRPSLATVFAPSFAGLPLDVGLAATGSPGTSFSVGGGTLALDQAAGDGNGDISVTTTSAVSGDFVAMVTALGKGLGRADLGLVLGTADWTYTLADVFLNGLAGTVNGNVFQPAFSGAFLPKSTEALTLTITRQGDTVTDIFDAGAGPVVINSGTDPALGGPVNIGLFLLEAAGDTGAHHGAFTHFQVASGSDVEVVPVSEPTAAALMMSGLLAFCGLHVVARRRQWRGVSAYPAASGTQRPTHGHIAPEIHRRTREWLRGRTTEAASRATAETRQGCSRPGPGCWAATPGAIRLACPGAGCGLAPH